MSHIITRCPKCSTAFRVTQAQLGVAKGSVRCGSCLSVFKALDHISKPVNKARAQQQVNKSPISAVLPKDTPAVSSKLAVSPKKNHQTKEPVKTQKAPPKIFSKQKDKVGLRNDVHTASDKTLTGGSLLDNAPSTTNQSAAVKKPVKKNADQKLSAKSPEVEENTGVKAIKKLPHSKDDLLSTIQPAPVEMLWNEGKSTGRLWLWSLGVVLLIFSIFFQIAIFQFQTLSKIDPYRNVYKAICPVLNCTLPTLVDATKIRISNLILRSHPEADGALIIDIILLNSANFSQPYPELLLEFSDINDKRIAFRQFHANEYLGGEVAGTTLMPINQPIQLSIEIVDPGSAAVNYEMYIAQNKNRG